MDCITFTVPGRIAGKGRIRHAGKHHFMDDKTRVHEGWVKFFASQAMRGKAVLEGPVELVISEIRNTPASWSKKRKASAFYVTGKPDCSNVLKLIEDALNGIVWKDDSQITQVNYSRRYYDHEGERVEIKIFTPEREHELGRAAA